MPRSPASPPQRRSPWEPQEAEPGDGGSQRGHGSRTGGEFKNFSTFMTSNDNCSVDGQKRENDEVIVFLSHQEWGVKMERK